ncbi:MAG TPA: trigger factor [Clostridiaceae bacterium]
MKVKVENLEKNVISIEVTVEAAIFEEAIQKSYTKNAAKYSVPGFRKGKVPISLIKRHYGEGVFYEDAVNFCCEVTYPEAIKENNISPVDFPEIDVVHIGGGEEFVYTAKVIVKPEVTLGEYKNIEAKKVDPSVQDKDIEARLKSMVEKNSRIEDLTEGTIENGNIAIIDFKGFVDGVVFEGGTGEDYSLEIGSHSFIDTFEEQLVGMKIGESKDVDVTFPAEYGKEELNGKVAKFEVTIKGIKVKELPALDDEFAKESSEFETLDQLKADIKRELSEANIQKAKIEYEEAVVDAVCANMEVDIPSIMIDKEVDAMLKDLEGRLSYQGLDLKTYYQYTNSTEDQVRIYMKESAVKRVKTDLVFEKIAAAEEIIPTEEEIAKKASEMASAYESKDVEQTTKLLLQNQHDFIKLGVVNEKIVKFLVDNSKEIA